MQNHTTPLLAIGMQVRKRAFDQTINLRGAFLRVLSRLTLGRIWNPYLESEERFQEGPSPRGAPLFARDE